MIDTHHHFWNYNIDEFGWIDENMSILRKDYLVKDLLTEIEQTTVESVISVQARTSKEETEFLLDLAEENDFIQGIVGWLPLWDDSVEVDLEKYSSNKWLKGIRHVVQAEADGFMLRPDFNKGIEKLQDFNLPYDILITHNQLEEAIQFVDKHPKQCFVVDHIAKPEIRAHEFAAKWQTDISELAKRENVCCKVSGIATEIQDSVWKPNIMKPYYETILESFGPNRMMIGSDWPVCRLQLEYSTWVHLCQEWLSPLSEDEQFKIKTQNAINAYNL